MKSELMRRPRFPRERQTALRGQRSGPDSRRGASKGVIAELCGEQGRGRLKGVRGEGGGLPLSMS